MYRFNKLLVDTQLLGCEFNKVEKV